MFNAHSAISIYIIGILNSLCCLFSSIETFAGFGNRAKDLKFELFSPKDGLSQYYVRCIYQDKEGFIWFCTKDGLNKYDGYRVTVYRNNPSDRFSLPDNYVTCITDDNYGNMWIGNNKGLCAYNKRKDEFHQIIYHTTVNPQFSQIDYINLVDNRMFVCANGTIIYFDIRNVISSNFNSIEQQIVELSINDSLKHSGNDLFVHGLNISVISKDSLFYYDLKSALLVSKNPKSDHWLFNVIDFSSFLKGNYRILLLKKMHNIPKVAIVTTRGVVIYNYKECKIENTINIADSNVNVVFCSDIYENQIILQTNKGYLLCDLDIENFSELRTNIGNVTSIGLLDRDNAWWLFSMISGVVRFDGRRQAIVSDIAINDKTTIPFLLDTFYNTVYSYNVDPQFRDSRINEEYYTIFSKLIEDLSKNDKPLVDFNYEKNLHSYLKVLKDKSILNLRTKNLVVFVPYKSEMRLITIDINKESVIGIDVIPGIAKFSENRYVSKVYEGKNGILWITTSKGLYRFNRQKKDWQVFRHNNKDTTSLNSDDLFSITPDPKEPNRYLWIGTNGYGLERFDINKSTVSHFTVNDGLLNNVVYGVISDKSGNLWVSTNSGLAQLKLDSNIKNIKVRTYTQEDGLPHKEFNRYEYGRVNDSELIFGGIMGYITFKPQSFSTDIATNTKVMLTQLSFNNKVFHYKTDTSIINCPIQFARLMVVPPEKNMFTIEFAAMDYLPANNKRYQYLLTGFDKDWVETNNNNTATFTNLSPGKYTFNVRASVLGGEWSRNITSIDIIVDSPWWNKWWFKGLIVIIALSSLYLIYILRISRSNRINELRNRIANDLHDDIGSTLSSIAIASTLIKRKYGDESTDLANWINGIQDNTSNMMESMNDIVWSLNGNSDTLANVINRVMNFAVETLEPIGCSIALHSLNNDSKIKLNPVEKKNIYLILKEAINNIAKHSGATKVSFTFQAVKSKEIVLIVKDNGKGFSINEQFSSSTGFGLKSMQKRAGELNWDILINSTIDIGTEIKVYIKFNIHY